MDTNQTLSQEVEGIEQAKADNTGLRVSPASSPAPSDEKANVKSLLAEARNTREMLMHFVSAVETGTFSGGQMMNVAKGMAFLDAILRQNNSHIQNLQERLK